MSGQPVPEVATHSLPEREPDIDAPISNARSLTEWLENPALLLVPEIVIPHLAIEGRVTLLSGREKIGKSTLAACLVSAASRGDAVLDVPLIEQSSCLWYALDEPVADAVRRFSVLGAEPDAIGINDQPRSATELLAALEIDLAEYPENDLVVVDNLSRVFAMSGVDPNSSREVEPVLAKIVDLFHRLNVSAVLLYHTGKNGKEYRGSTAIGATVDEVLTLRKRGDGDEDDFDDDDTDDGRRLLVKAGRNLRGRVQLTFGKDGVYRVYDAAAAPSEKILAALQLHGRVNSRNELVRLAGVNKEKGLHAISELIGSSQIIDKGRELRPAVAGSDRGTIAGTIAEPRKEPLAASGSRSNGVGVSETGTDTLSRRIENGVRQTQHLTQHGKRWFDEDDYERDERAGMAL